MFTFYQLIFEPINSQLQGDGERKDLAFGGASHKDLAVILQQKRKLNLMSHSSIIVQHSALLRSMQVRLSALQACVKDCREMGDNNQARTYMDGAIFLMQQIKSAEQDMKNFKAESSTSAPVDAFLKRDTHSMGLVELQKKKGTGKSHQKSVLERVTTLWSSRVPRLSNLLILFQTLLCQNESMREHL